MCKQHAEALYAQKHWFGLDDQLHDLAWDTFQQTQEAFDPEGDFVVLLRIIFTRRCYDAIRRLGRRKQVEPLWSELRSAADEEQDTPDVLDFSVAETEGPSAALETEEAVGQLWSAVKQMSRPSRRAVALRADGLRSAQIAQRMESVGPVTDLIYHDRKKAKGYLLEAHGWDLEGTRSRRRAEHGVLGRTHRL